MSKQSNLLTLGALGVGAYLLYNHFKTAVVVPPLIVTGWSNGTATWQLGTAKGTLLPTGTGTVTATGTYGIQVNDYDGQGYDILVLQGSNVVNSLYVNGNGSYT